MKNSADQGGCYPQRPKAEVDNTLRDLQLVMVNYACGFNQSETEKYFERIINNN